MIKWLSLVCFVILGVKLYASSIAISIDDAPRGGGSLFSAMQRTQIIIKKLNELQIKAVFFVNTGKFATNQGLERVTLYDNMGHFIGNHTHSHPSLYDITADDFTGDIQLAHQLLSRFKNFKKWFRYPYLSTGNTVSKRDQVREYLEHQGYQIGHVTIDTQDWFLESLLANQLDIGKSFNSEVLCKTYSEMMWDNIQYFDKIAKTYLSHSPKHMLLLHENDLLALCIDTLVQHIYNHQWLIISPQDAMTDPIYKQQPTTLFSNDGQIAALVYDLIHKRIEAPWTNLSDIESHFLGASIFKTTN